MTSQPSAPLSAALPGTWRLTSRIDTDAQGRRRPELMLGEDPVALLIYDRAGHFSAQFMRRDRTAPAEAAPAGPAGPNNTGASGGYDAYFGAYAVDDASGVVTQWLAGALSAANVGNILARRMEVRGDDLTIRLDTAAVDGTPVTRTLTWVRVG